ncbi:MAG: hypothetical protein IT302_13850 [Dehalococcoidia bacterium]|nr:hypothetical protein [Dehalococcoidia bacterium]
MTEDAAMLGRVRDAFASCTRPERFTNHPCCEECEEHQQTLASRDLDTLCFDDIGDGAWDPITMATPEAFAYYLPALARLALDEPHGTLGWFGPQLMFHLERDGPRNERWRAMTPEQRDMVVALLDHIIETRAVLIDTYWSCPEALFRARSVYADRG